MFSGQPFGAGEIVGYRYSTILYSNLTMLNPVKKYGEGKISVVVEIFSTW